jgi:hypothetical protein
MQADEQVERQLEMQQSSSSGSAHVSDERLAAFDHEPFSAEERAHLGACPSCRAELQAYVALQSLAIESRQRDGEADAPRLVAWEAIAEGLQQPERQPAPVLRSAPSSRWSTLPFLRRAAAAVVLLTGGAVLGRMSGEISAARAMGAEGAEAAAAATARPVAFGSALPPDGYATIEQATAVLERAQRDYERASLWLAANDTTARDSDVYRARLAALDQMMAASRAALRDAPQDPVLNHYFLAAYTAREATLQQLGGALPVDKTIERY